MRAVQSTCSVFSTEPLQLHQGHLNSFVLDTMFCGHLCEADTDFFEKTCRRDVHFDLSEGATCCFRVQRARACRSALVKPSGDSLGDLETDALFWFGNVAKRKLPSVLSWSVWASKCFKSHTRGIWFGSNKFKGVELSFLSDEPALVLWRKQFERFFQAFVLPEVSSMIDRRFMTVLRFHWSHKAFSLLSARIGTRKKT